MSEQTKGGVPKKVGVLLYPGFEPLDVFGPFEAIHILAWTHRLELVILGPTLDPVSTQVNDSKYNVVASPFGARVLPTHTYDTAPKDLDVLIVPGGVGTASPEIRTAVEFIVKAYPKLKYLITVCTGSTLAALAGVLDGKKATTNKSLFKATSELGPKVQWVKTARYVVDGNIWTASGVTAGIDATLGWISHVFGEEEARKVSVAMEYEWRDDRSRDPFAYMYGEAQ